MCSMIAVAEGIGTAASANTDSVFSTSLAIITLIAGYLPLQQAWSKVLNTDAENIFIANMEVPGNPGGAANVAAVTEQRNIDSTQSDLQTGNMDNLVQGQKGQAQLLGNAMTAIYTLQNPINELLQLQSQLLQQPI